MSSAPAGYRWMVSPDGYQADLVHEDEIARRCPTWTDCTEMTDAEVMQLMERRMWNVKNNTQLLVAA